MAVKQRYLTAPGSLDAVLNKLIAHFDSKLQGVCCHILDD